MTHYSVIWANFVREKRKQRNMSILDFAAACNLHYNYIFQFERGRLPSLDVVLQMAKALNEDPSEWLATYVVAYLDSRGELDAIRITPQNFSKFIRDHTTSIPPELMAALLKIRNNDKLLNAAARILNTLVEAGV